MTQQIFDRSVALDAKHRPVPVRWLEALIGNAMSPEDAFEFGFDSDRRANEIVRAVLHWRDTGKLEVVHANGHGVIRDQDVLRGHIKRDDLARMLAEEWNMGLVEPLVGEVNATSTTEQAAATAPVLKEADPIVDAPGDDAKWTLMRKDEWPETACEVSWRKRTNIGTAVARGAVPASAEPVPMPSTPEADNSPRPLKTGDMAFCFDGLRYSEAKWEKPLGDKPKWLEACIAAPGQQGVSETKWNPVCVGAELVRAGHVPANRVRARFQTQPLLTPWLDAWKTHEAEYIDNS